MSESKYVQMSTTAIGDEPEFALMSGHSVASDAEALEWRDWAMDVISRVQRYYGNYLEETYRKDGGHLPPDPDGMDAEEYGSTLADYLLLHIDTMKIEALVDEHGDQNLDSLFSDIASRLKGYGFTDGVHVPAESWRNQNSMAPVSGTYTFPSFDSYKSLGLGSIDVDYDYGDGVWKVSEATNRFGTLYALPTSDADLVSADPFVARLTDYGIDVSSEAEKAKRAKILQQLTELNVADSDFEISY